MITNNKKNKELVKVLLHGNVGNHLFQFAASLNLLKKKVNLNVFKFFDTQEMSYEISSINIFDFIKNLNKVKYSNNIQFKIKKFLFQKRCFKIIEPPFNRKKDKIFNTPVLFDGYFQNITWYKHTAILVTKLIFRYNKSFYKKLKTYEVVLNCRGKEFFFSKGALDKKYYLLAIKKLKIKKNVKIKIIGEDYMLKVSLYEFLKDKGFSLYKISKDVSASKLKVKKDFFTITKSKKLIIPNSSFSWWAASCRYIFNKKYHKEVCMPDKWYPNHLKVYGYPESIFKWKKAKAFFTGKIY